MATIKALICIDGSVLDGSGIASCPTASQQWQEIQLTDSTFLEDALYNVDTETVSAIFGGALLLFVVGMGCGWVHQALKQAR